MSPDLINICLGFIEGFGLIISPCILPILPIILAGSLEGSKIRPIGIVTGFVLAFTLFTLFSRKLVQLSGIDISFVRYISYVLLFIFGIIMLSESLSDKFARLTQQFANTGSSLSSVNNPQEGFMNGVVFGVLIGLVWTPCAGPILAAVIVQTVIQKTSFSSFLILLSFGIGAAIPMLIIAIFGRKTLQSFSFFREHGEWFRKILGIIIIASVVYMVYGEGVTVSLAKSSSTEIKSDKLIDGISYPYSAPSIAGITGWINSPPLNLDELKGKVVLIDFWTYSCINCIRTLPYLKDWYEKYHDKGLEIIGVHTPEFEFEKNFDNVKYAVAQDGITYPVALDSNFVTWQNYHNSYWPAHYLIDKNGKVVYEHFGEGEYATTENNIRFLLGMGETNAPSNFGEESAYGVESPETYFGYDRMEHYASPEVISYNKSAHYSFPNKLSLNQWALQGDWSVEGQRIISSQANAALKFHFGARKVFVVMGSASGFSIPVKILLNGNDVVSAGGKDVENSTITVNKNRLYEAIVLPRSASGTIELIALAPGLEIYTFTFGG